MCVVLCILTGHTHVLGFYSIMSTLGTWDSTLAVFEAFPLHVILTETDLKTMQAE